MKGKVHLVGAGPGDPELLTIRALRLLRSAEVVLYDDLVSREILDLIPSTAQLHNVGKRSGAKKIQQDEINFLMIALAESGKHVVRLKSGDPLIFGRAGEEMEALRTAEIDFEIVPGITSALAAAASAQIPLTDRRASSAVVFLAGHQAKGTEAEWSKLAASGSTLVVFMPGRGYEELAAKLRKAGLSVDTPCAVIAQATTPREQIHRTTIGELARSPQLPAPSLLVVGEVARQSDAAVENFIALGTKETRPNSDEESFA